MDKAKKELLEGRGWVVGDTRDLLQLSAAEEAYINTKIHLAARLKQLRIAQHITQKVLAATLGTSQSRVAKMEAADPSVSLDLIVKSILTLQPDAPLLGK